MRKVTSLDDLVDREWLSDKNENWWEIFKEKTDKGACVYAMMALNGKTVSLNEIILRNFEYTLTASDLIHSIIADRIYRLEGKYNQIKKLEEKNND